MCSSLDLAAFGSGKEVVMAKVIEFHIPANFQPKKYWTPQELRGKVIDFPAITRKSA
jgi:hypothetical protein